MKDDVLLPPPVTHSTSTRPARGRRRSVRSGEEDDSPDANSDRVSRASTKPPNTPRDGPVLPSPGSRGRKLTSEQLLLQRIIFISVILVVNIGLGVLIVFADVGYAPLVIMLVFKLQDCLSTMLAVTCLSWKAIRACFSRRRESEPPREGKWILTLLPAYNESEEQILKALDGLRDNVVLPDRQVVVIVLDGKPKDGLRHGFSTVVSDFSRPYRSLRGRFGILRITAGFFPRDLPVMLIEKDGNGGKKDTLVLALDLFNYPRDDMPAYTRLLRHQLWHSVLPPLTADTGFQTVDMMFCTDADSQIHEDCIPKLVSTLSSTPNVIAACGLVLVEFEPGSGLSPWNPFQLVQYGYGQFVRRWAESLVGKVTCLPGCVTMLAVRPEMAGAVADFARPVDSGYVVEHQVQNLGTDRRLTYCMLSQHRDLKTVFVPDAVSETVAPQSFRHYLHQRRRWGSNAYFNNFFYCRGRNMNLWTRLIALLQIIRQSCVFYRLLNTILFIRALVTSFHLLKILPLLIVGQLPTAWFLVCLFCQRALRVRIHHLALGFLINKLVSPIMSSIVFAAVATNLGKASWGMSGITASSPAASQRPATASSTGGQRPSVNSDSAANSLEERGPTSSTMAVERESRPSVDFLEKETSRSSNRSGREQSSTTSSSSESDLPSSTNPFEHPFEKELRTTLVFET
ncbi:ESV-1-84 protein [Ophiocordyceps camponoti-floridani]|uniref:chitin synthase n=1 Tax=Ophiocordyceps camponoti-floridani TaxID=2030778 RepID=A0A8H4Q405_9HYPO|nr:ESV-1-84 protein [Ophiocordyceps camponoti-floridani]